MAETTQLTRHENRISFAWFVMYPNDAYAMGPYRYDEMVPANVPVEEAFDTFGAYPSQLWPEGKTEEIAEYEYHITVPSDCVDEYEE